MQNNWNTTHDFPLSGKIEGYDLKNNYHVYDIEISKKSPFGASKPFVLHDESGAIYNSHDIIKWRRID